jgi:RNA polymerase subunit RPABC4/transcription elongation factor Spt4
MSKAHRGKGLRETVSRGRETCPVCKRESVKVLYEQEVAGAKTKICKICKATLANAK